MRICSLLPSSTEIVYALGLEDQLVAVTHECDYPLDVLRKPRVTKSSIPTGLSSAKIDFRVRQKLSDVGTLYELDIDQLNSLKPELILTQQLCMVCAVSYENVARVAHQISSKPTVMNLEPKTLEGIFESIITIGMYLDAGKKAQNVVQSLRRRIERVHSHVLNKEKKKVLCLEWLEPPFCAGHWIPELVELAGGVDLLGRKHQPSRQVAWDEILSYNPDVIIVMCCGFSVERTLKEFAGLRHSTFERLSAVKHGNVFVVDGSSYFSRPGPRIVDSLEILARILHPEIFPIDYPEQVVCRVPNSNR